MRAGPSNSALTHSLLFSAVLALCGCWTPPRSDVQPPGEPRLIAEQIQVQSDADSAVVQAVDVQAHTLALEGLRGRSRAEYSVSPLVGALAQVQAGDRIRAVLSDELSVYVLHAGESAFIAGERVEPDARVLSVDPTYRLLIIQYPDSEQETFKVGLDVKLEAMQAGDAVVIRPVRLIALKRRK